MKALDSIDSSLKTAEQPPPDSAPSSHVVAHKFGGSSLASAERIRRVADLLRSRPEATQVVVVSAMQGVTDALIGLTTAAAGKAEWRPQCQELLDRHLAAASELLGAKANPMQAWLRERFDELAEKLHAISVLGSAGRDIADGLSGKGEVWSAHLLHALMQAEGADYGLLDARELLVVRSTLDPKGALYEPLAAVALGSVPGAP